MNSNRMVLIVVGSVALYGCEAKKEAAVESTTVTTTAPATTPTPPPPAPVAATAPAVPSYPGAVVDGAGTVTASGLKYFDLVVGDGPQPSGPATRVTVHYSGWLTDGTKFDSSVDRGRPSTFALNGVIAGWTEGVGSMRVGGKRKLVIPPDLAYGPSGKRPSIPPNATLIFDIELIEIVE